MTKFSFFWLILIGMALGCSSSDELTEEELARLELCRSIRNSVKVDLTIAIQKRQLHPKVYQNASLIHALIKKDIIAILDRNLEDNQEVSVASCGRKFRSTRKIWSNGFSRQEQQAIMRSLENSFELIDLPEDQEDENELLDYEQIYNLKCFFQGILDTLKPYLKD